MNLEQQIKLTIAGLVMEYDVEDPMALAREMFNWIMESADKPRSAELKSIN